MVIKIKQQILKAILNDLLEAQIKICERISCTENN